MLRQINGEAAEAVVGFCPYCSGFGRTNILVVISGGYLGWRYIGCGNAELRKGRKILCPFHKSKNLILG